MRTDIIASEYLGVGQKLILTAGLLAASGFTLVSIAANIRFGVSLASTPFDRIVYATLSIAADLMKSLFRLWWRSFGGRESGYLHLRGWFFG